MAQLERSGADYPRKRTAIAVSAGDNLFHNFIRRCSPGITSAIYVEPGEANATLESLHAQNALSLRLIVSIEGPICGTGKPHLNVPYLPYRSKYQTAKREPVTAATNAALGKVDDRLDQIQDSIAALTEEVASIVRSGGSGDHASAIGYSPQSVSNFGITHTAYQGRAGPPSYGSLSSARPYGHRMPNIMSFLAPASLGPFSYDSSQEFFSGEIGQGDALFHCIEDALINDVQADFSPQACWRLQRAFASEFLRWIPIFDDETCLQHVRIASANRFSDNSASTCLTLLMFAIGAMAGDEQLYHEDPSQLPGFQYLALSYKILKNMRSPAGDVKHLRCCALFS
jgi:hypothetical protein